ncbi:polysaccharide deacetylase family protein [Marilutibacter alkalisoli]|uniref:Polysaccharide deacetylase family protein n=1 Tax=Marilutibacter alkalisoli TaxID=2591633 RepID=A0A514BQS5_9GAMM|nr:polysaccharide deacetylase family protein [Lysobacter alkalisoli]QDH69753.1 polysaccharide deacetylase family protein [Lysobacter alkalisoli]
MIATCRQWLRYLFALAVHYSGLDLLYRRLSGGGLVLLMLHRIRDDDDPYPLSINATTLTTLVDWLLQREVLLSLDDGLRRLDESDARSTAYAITLDDGYRDNLRMLEGRLAGVPAVLYLATRHIGAEPIWAYRLADAIHARRNDLLTLGPHGLGNYDLSDPDEVRRALVQIPRWLKTLPDDSMQACLAGILARLDPGPVDNERTMLGWDDVRTLHDKGIEIGGHTRNHVLLSQVDEQTAHDEVFGCSRDIADALDMPPRHFAYPNGTVHDFGDRDMLMVKRAGYATAATTIEGINRRGVDPFRLLRHNVHESRYLSPLGRLSPALFFSDTSGLLCWLRTRGRH